MFTVPEDQLVNPWTILNQMIGISLRGAVKTGLVIGGGYGGLVALSLEGPLMALVVGFIGGVTGCSLGLLLGLVNGLICAIVTILRARPLRSPHQHHRAMYTINPTIFGVLTLFGLNVLSEADKAVAMSASEYFLLFVGIPALLAALSGLVVGHELADWYMRRIRAEQRERQRARPPAVMLDARPPGLTLK